MKELIVFLEFVEKEEFIEGHECLEDIWRKWKNSPNTREESYILKGLINASTSLALYRLGKFEGAKRVWETFEKYRPLIKSIDSPYTPLYQKAELLVDLKCKEVMGKLPPL